MIEAALALTREHGLDDWSMRDLAAALDTWPNTISHHVGGREQVVEQVVDRVVGMMTNPEPGLGWQEWFRVFLHDGREVLRRHPGVARRLCRDGPAVPSAMPIMERGVGLLAEAGFGAQAPRAYALLLNSAILLVALADDRAASGLSQDTAASRLRDFAPAEGAGEPWALMHGYLREWTESPEDAFAALFDFTVDRVIAGLEQEPGCLHA